MTRAETRWVSFVVAAVAGAAVVGSAACGSTEDPALGAARLSHSDFFVVTGSHQGLDCGQCHDPNATSFSAAAAGVSCVGCHTAADCNTVHARVGGYAYATPTCIGCHKNGPLSALPANHDSDLFPITNTKHASIGCGNCHGPTKAVADLKCAPCHDQASMTSAHAAIPATSTGRLDRATYTNYQWTTSYCLKCHADGQVNRIAAHPSVRNGITGNNHRPFCLACHTTARTGKKTWGTDFSVYTCLACHTDNNGGGGA